MDERVPYSVRKERLRLAKLEEEAKLKLIKENKAYVVEVQIPLNSDRIILQSKTPTEEIAVMNFGKAPRPEPVVDTGPVEMAVATQSIEPEPVMNGIEEHGPVVSSMVLEEESADQTDFVVVEEAPAPEPVVVSVEIPPAAEEPVVVKAPEEPMVEEVPEPVPAEPVQAEPVVVEEAPLVEAEPVVVEEAPPAVEDEVLATTVVEEEKVSAAPEPEVEAPAEADIIPEAIRSTVLDLIYWRDVKKTGVVFGSMLFILLSLAIFSVLSVFAYLSLAILAVTLSFRVYKNIMQAVQKSGEGHPFKEYLELDIELNDVKTSKVVKLIMKHFNCTARELRRLFLVEDLVDSIKFGLLLWMLTYIGSWFNGMTLIINTVVIVFTLPKVYETYKVQIDNYLAMARSQFNKILQQVQSKLPFLKKKAKAQ